MTSINSNIPLNMVLPPLTSTSRYINRSKEVEVLPDNASASYSPDEIDELSFTLNSSSDFLDGQNSYLKFKLACVLTDGGADVATKHLSTGGAHSAIRSLEVRLANGTLLERVEEYGRLHALFSSYTAPQDHTDMTEFASGDSIPVKDYIPEESDEKLLEDATFTGGNFDASTGILTLTAGSASSEISENDVIFLGNGESSAFQSAFGIVKTVSSDTSVVLYGITQTDVADFDLDALTSVKILKQQRKGVVVPARKLCANTTDITLCLKPFSSFLQQSNLIPLPLLKNLQIVIRLAPANMLLVSGTGAAPAGAMVRSYTIKQPRMVCRFVEPSAEITQQYLDMYRGKGLEYHMVGYAHHQNTIDSGQSGSVSLRIDANVRSCRKIMSIVQSRINENNDTSSYQFDSAGTFLKAGITDYQYSVGSERFPHYSKLNVEDVYMVQNFQNALKVFNAFNNTLHKLRFRPDQYRANQTIDAITNESSKFLMGASLERDDDSAFTGMDLSQESVYLELTKSAVARQLTVRTWLAHDITLNVSANNGVVVRK